MPQHTGTNTVWMAYCEASIKTEDITEANAFWNRTVVILLVLMALRSRLRNAHIHSVCPTLNAELQYAHTQTPMANFDATTHEMSMETFPPPECWRQWLHPLLSIPPLFSIIPSYLSNRNSW